MEYLAELGAALHNARYVEVLSVDQAVIADAIGFMAVCSKPSQMRTQRLSVACACQTCVCRDNTLVLTLAGMQALATDWNENVRAAAVTQLANAAKCDDNVAVGALVEALKVALLPSPPRCSRPSASGGSLI